MKFMNLHITLLPIFASTLQLCSVYFHISFACWSDPMLIPGPTLFLFYLFYSLQDLPRSRPDNTFIFFRNKSCASGSCGAPKRALLGFTARWPLRRCSNVLNSSASKRSAGGGAETERITMLVHLHSPAPVPHFPQVCEYEWLQSSLCDLSITSALVL